MHGPRRPAIPRNPLRKDRILVVTGIPDQRPAIAVRFAKEIRQVAHSPDPLDAGAAAKRLGEIVDQRQSTR
jgi:hypothetical protein